MDSRYPSVEALTEKARQRMPGFAFDYLSGGCFSDVNLARNTQEIREIQLQPHYLRDFKEASQKTTLFGKTYDAPFGIAPVGLQGLMWPNSCEILAKAAKHHNIPFCLSTVGTASIETIADITKGDFWFQLYHPADNDLRDKLIERAYQAGCKTLVLLADTPTFAYRPKEIRNGLSIPPQMTLRNILQIITHPRWAIEQLITGSPEFKTMKPYIPKGLNMKHLGLFMNKTFSGRLTEDKIKAIRDKWSGNLVIKGIVNPADAERAIKLGVDGLIVSNHGGRQLDSGESTINALGDLVKKYGSETTLMMDGGMRSGVDIASSLASGAKFTFLGRAPMYGACAMGKQGGDQVLSILKRQLQQVMEQVGCEKTDDLPLHLLNRK
ncbi:L-lactate dehydrogenase [Zhongshania aliphaticivorans]|uniref:L-lactate dehydrogenase n=1 Tax=Zhongshania aliphaticivorans TaxID=1470434 RepID=A0A5S9QJK3_9GAMM|nr:alpha-hydroxy acid oxidase [Zhongshania aliphaticivorans]CAA0110543.1 L-lactate dehydrogenase [Zhongshania aliphaticivorans]CAA0118175.1 L-lactate dehydrogenase [Zhongshania aliphaticivorans]CAA0122183.1 L-lactate dehydrogenase [Zhongshania aliphaticivorans]